MESWGTAPGTDSPIIPCPISANTWPSGDGGCTGDAPGLERVCGGLPAPCRVPSGGTLGHAGGAAALNPLEPGTATPRALPFARITTRGVVNTGVEHNRTGLEDVRRQQRRARTARQPPWTHRVTPRRVEGLREPVPPRRGHGLLVGARVTTASRTVSHRTLPRVVFEGTQRGTWPQTPFRGGVGQQFHPQRAVEPRRTGRFPPRRAWHTLVRHHRISRHLTPTGVQTVSRRARQQPRSQPPPERRVHRFRVTDTGDVQPELGELFRVKFTGAHDHGCLLGGRIFEVENGGHHLFGGVPKRSARRRLPEKIRPRQCRVDCWERGIQRCTESCAGRCPRGPRAGTRGCVRTLAVRITWALGARPIGTARAPRSTGDGAVCGEAAWHTRHGVGVTVFVLLALYLVTADASAGVVPPARGTRHPPLAG
eukprot:3936744-Rhodomonas_salina.1